VFGWWDLDIREIGRRGNIEEWEGLYGEGKKWGKKERK
jgi:hypothetical protein